MISYPLNLEYIEILTMLVFTIGLISFLYSSTLVKALISIEIMLNSGLLNLIASSDLYNNAMGSTLALFVLAISAAETVVAIAIFTAVFRKKGTSALDVMSLLRW
ncbi:MAG: NADH-quinone oxidoreductase subunit NuoK [Thermoplasmatales archaeon]